MQTNSIVLADYASQHPFRLVNDVVEADRFRLEYLFAAECQQLHRQLCRAVARAADSLDLRVHRIAGGDAPQRQIGIAVDYRQQVVEVVGYASGKTADALHFLRL